MSDRYLKAQVLQDLEEKMVFLAGPRQVGKTTLAKEVCGPRGLYLNWDADEDRTAILKKEFKKTDFIVFDEIHKFKRWRNYLKGIYDKKDDKLKILVTGSARLDLYRRGGDSLQGRYHFLRMYPLSVAELGISNENDFQGLLNLGGFPEPYFKQRKSAADRWTSQYQTRVVRDDVASLEQVQDVSLVEMLAHRLPHCVGSPLSINALREDLQVAHKSVVRWMGILERLYVQFPVAPFGSPLIKAVKKERKHYLYDWNVLADVGARFENLVAVHLLKWCHWREDTLGEALELRYFRLVDGSEVDFVVTLKGKPVLAVECKWQDSVVHKPLKYFKGKFPQCRAVQVVGGGGKEFVTADGIEVLSAWKLLASCV